MDDQTAVEGRGRSRNTTGAVAWRSDGGGPRHRDHRVRRWAGEITAYIPPAPPDAVVFAGDGQSFHLAVGQLPSSRPTCRPR